MGRQAKLFKFESTGETVFVPPISGINERRKLMRNFPPPKPPVVIVDYGSGPVPTENPSDPDYHKALEIHERMLNERLVEVILRKIALKQSLNDEQRAAVTEYRELMSDLEDIHENDKVVWFFEIAMGEDPETLELMKVATGQKDPQEEKVQLETDNFRRAVQGNGHLEESDHARETQHSQSGVGVD